MKETKTHPGTEKWGRVVVRPDAPDFHATTQSRAKRPLPVFTSELCTWIPPAQLTPPLLGGFTLPLRCVVSACDGLRRFYPVESIQDFLRDAFDAGLALLIRDQALSARQRDFYWVMWLLFERARASREHLDTTFRHPMSLRVTKSARGGAGQSSLLPDSVGLNAEGQGTRWSVERLLNEGREEARAQGVEQPTRTDCVHYGLARAARLNPLHLPDEKVPAFLRQAFYRTDHLSGDLPSGVHQLVLERTLEAVRRHGGDTPPKFKEWFSGPHSSLIWQIAKKKRAPGGELGLDVVRRALLDLSWDAYQHVATCIHTVMEAFRRSLPPLHREEKPFFDQMYLKQPHFGQLPFVMITERFGFLRGVIWDVWDHLTDQVGIAAMYRLLDFYAEMAATRRAADRKLKAKRARPTGKGKLPVECPLDPKTHVPVGKSPLPALWAKLCEYIRESRGVQCGCKSPQWIEHVEDPYAAEVIINHWCDQCGAARTSTLSRAEFGEIEKRVSPD